jgi:hypothetical protein
MNEQKMQEYLMEALSWVSSEDGEIKDFETFEAKGLLTNNSGIVLKMRDGTEFQLSIKQSK